VIPAAWISEAWFTLTYKLVKRKGDPEAPTYLLGYDSVPIIAEKELYDLVEWTQGQETLSQYLIETPTPALVKQVLQEESGGDQGTAIFQEWRRRFLTYLDAYGHMIYNLDFGSPVPADDPAPVIDTFKLFLRGEGVNPYARQSASAAHREAAVQAKTAQLKGWRLKFFQKNLARAQKYAPLREDGLADVGLSYPLVRAMLRETGRRFASAGMLEAAEDIFWLEQDEVEAAAGRLDQGQSLEDLSSLVAARKAIWRAARRAAPPMMLPQIKVFGADLMALKSRGLRSKKGVTLKGVGASPGEVSAPASVVESPGDFSEMKAGDILVAPLTTPAWTPLFARAAGVVTDVGGPLSHGSIVAREYGIPAVLGTGDATKRIRTGQVIEVDGDQGKVRLR
jgi:pyruvate,water dikinase